MNKSMIAKQKKWTAMLVTVTFAWLLQVQAMPLAAADTTEQVAAASAERETGFVEQEGDTWAKPRTLPIVFILGVVVVLALLIAVRLGGFGRDVAPRTASGISRNRGGGKAAKAILRNGVDSSPCFSLEWVATCGE
jgi:hypothetical protein